MVLEYLDDGRWAPPPYPLGTFWRVRKRIYEAKVEVGTLLKLVEYRGDLGYQIEGRADLMFDPKVVEWNPEKFERLTPLFPPLSDPEPPASPAPAP